MQGLRIFDAHDCPRTGLSWWGWRVDGVPAAFRTRRLRVRRLARCLCALGLGSLPGSRERLVGSAPLDWLVRCGGTLNRRLGVG